MKSNKFLTKEACNQLLKQISDKLSSEYGSGTGPTKLEIDTEYLEDNPEYCGCVCARVTISNIAGVACYVLDEDGISIEISEMQSDFGSNALILDFLSKAQRVHYIIDELARS